jgi:hypothetical protein
MPDIDYDLLCSLVSSELKPRIERHAGLGVFARERARFEGWMKAELVDVLVGKGYDAVPEKGTIDVVCRPQEAAIELKTINTNYMCEGTAYKQKGITQNIAEVVADIKKLETANYFKKMIVFVAYPLVHEHPEWQNRHLPKIAMRLKQMNYEPITFANSIKGVMYAGEVGNIETHTFDAP